MSYLVVVVVVVVGVLPGEGYPEEPLGVGADGFCAGHGWLTGLLINKKIDKHKRINYKHIDRPKK